MGIRVNTGGLQTGFPFSIIEMLKRDIIIAITSIECSINKNGCNDATPFSDTVFYL